jgi:hypothetical protein
VLRVDIKVPPEKESYAVIFRITTIDIDRKNVAAARLKRHAAASRFTGLD